MTHVEHTHKVENSEMVGTYVADQAARQRIKQKKCAVGDVEAQHVKPCSAYALVGQKKRSDWFFICFYLTGVYTFFYSRKTVDWFYYGVTTKYVTICTDLFKHLYKTNAHVSLVFTYTDYIKPI